MTKEIETTSGTKLVKAKYMGEVATSFIGYGEVLPEAVIELSEEEYERTLKNTRLFKLLKK